MITKVAYQQHYGSEPAFVRPDEGIFKTSEFAATDKGGNPNVHKIHFTRGSIIKCAAEFPPEVRTVLGSLDDDPGGVWTVCNALGSLETYGVNANGDGFPKLGLAHMGDLYGHKTFEKNAYPYEHHVNKDPAKSCGDRVKFAYWDEPMDKVLLIYKVARAKAPHIAERLDKGEPVPTSMGCKVPFDVCTKCGKKAKKTAEYCDDLKYYMGRTEPDGTKIGALNIFPNFFDISHVLRGADKISYAMGKVNPADFAKAANDRHVYAVPSAWKAEADPFRLAEMQKAAAWVDKRATNKEADIEKEIPGVMEKMPDVDPEEAAVGEALPLLEAREPQLPKDLLNAMGEAPLGSVLDTVGGLGMVLQPAEFQRVLLAQSGQLPLADQLERHAADFSQLATAILFKQAAAPGVLGEEASGRSRKALNYWDGGPDLLSAVIPLINPTPDDTQSVPVTNDGESWMSPKHSNDIRFDHDLADILQKYAWQRSGYSKALYGRMLDTLAPHTKVAGDGLSDQAQGPTRIIVISGGKGSGIPGLGMEMGEGKKEKREGGGLGSMGSMLSSILPTMLAMKVLYELYRGKSGDMHEKGLAKRPAMREPNIKKMGFELPENSSSTYNIKSEQDHRSEPERFRDQLADKHGGLTKLLASRSGGLPTRAFFKFAYRSGQPGRVQPGLSKKADLLCSDFFLSAYLAEPLHNREKRATVMAVADNNLIDAATLAGLTYAQRVLGGN